MARPGWRQVSFGDAELRAQAAARNPRLQMFAKLLDDRRELIEKVGTISDAASRSLGPAAWV